MFSKKALGPVVALSLLLVVAVTSAVTFQIWFQGYSGSIYTNVETSGSSANFNQEINAVINNNVYLKNSNKENLTIKKVEIGGKTCTINQNSSSSIVKLDISSCTQNLTQDRYEVVIHTNKRIFQKDFFYNLGSSSLGTSTTDFTTCATILNTGGSNGTGIYTINPGSVEPFNVTCDMSTDGGGWIKLELNDTTSSYSNGDGVIAAQYCGDLSTTHYTPFYNHISSQIPMDEQNEGGLGIKYDIEYINPATGEPFNQSQLNAIRSQITTMSNQTKQTAITADDDCYADNRRVLLYDNNGTSYDLTPGTGTDKLDSYAGYYWHTQENQTETFGEFWGTLTPNKLPQGLIIPEKIEFLEMDTTNMIGSCTNDHGSGKCGYGIWGYEENYVLVK